MPKKSMLPLDNQGLNETPLPLDPIIEGLLDRLPEIGTVWPKAKREAWLNILRQSFELLYEDEAKALPSTAPPGARPV